MSIAKFKSSTFLYADCGVPVCRILYLIIWGKNLQSKTCITTLHSVSQIATNTNAGNLFGKLSQAELYPGDEETQLC